MLVTIAPPVFDVEVALAYAGPDNIIGRPIYARPLCLLRPEAAARLAAAASLARAIGLSLRLLDAYRPPEAQAALWAVLPDPAYVADPRTGSNHSRGVAVDLTLIDGSGLALDMGTSFDAATPLSHHGNTAITAEAQRNRALLLGVMTAAGWVLEPTEWWHYQLPEARRFPLLADGVAGPPLMKDHRITQASSNANRGARGLNPSPLP